ncbi:MAG: phosphoribosyltransferase [Candidatus Peregrinibacteria bacterium GW2011_GWE2_39_6]|nr:MAG: phosphoribosyltransferase [Candidatus Peregrinibacteria bacterium GW2011_GWE2_39_6]
MKYHHGYDIAPLLGQWMASAFLVQKNIVSYFEKFTLNPVPLHPQREHDRGYNQAFLLAKSLSEIIHLNLTDYLKRHRNTPPQAHLDRESRLKNLQNSFSLKEKTQILNKKFILVDDVCTTGSTLNECAKILKFNGAKTVWGLVLARGYCQI